MAEVIMPKMGDAMEEGTLLSWKKQDGESVKAGDVLAEIETDKSNVEVPAEDDGVLRIQAKEGQILPVGAVIATIGDTAANNAAMADGEVSKPAEPSAAVQAAPKPPAQPGGAASARPSPVVLTGAKSAGRAADRERVKASPLARSVARERSVDIAQITGTGPNGRIIEADVLAFVENGRAAPSNGAQFVAPQARPAGEVSKRASVPTQAVVPAELTAMRKVIARRMVESKTTIPHFYITSEIDVAEVMALREKLNSYEEGLTKITLNDMIVKASAKALVKFPAVNAVYRDEKIYPGSGIYIGIAVALDDGLIVPVVRDADRIPLRRLAETSKDLIKKARDKKLQPSEYTGGTFTVSNLGGFDVENFIAIIDPSQGAILAVSSIVKKPVALEDETIAVRPRMNVTFSGDHRAMDGATGAKFLQELKRLLQNPLSLLE